jgi:putative ABC transport system permease protein
MRRAAAVIVRSGLSTRPAISQPRPTEATAMMPRAIPDSISSLSSTSLLSAAAIGASGGPQTVTGPGGTSGTLIGAPAAGHTAIAVPMSASVTIGAIVLPVLLAIAGGLLAGLFGGWRAARLRPAAALARVA